MNGAGVDYSGMIRLLNGNILDIQFTKVDGSDRNMVCTLNTSDGTVPEIKEGYNDPQKDRITVWDLQAEDWRSFKFSRLTRCCVMVGLD